MGAGRGLNRQKSPSAAGKGDRWRGACPSAEFCRSGGGFRCQLLALLFCRLLGAPDLRLAGRYSGSGDIAGFPPFQKERQLFAGLPIAGNAALAVGENAQPAGLCPDPAVLAEALNSRARRWQHSIKVQAQLVAGLTRKCAEIARGPHRSFPRHLIPRYRVS